MLIARNRRARTIGKANAARTLTATHQTASALNRLRSSIHATRSHQLRHHTILEAETVEDRLTTLEREDQIDRLLEDLKGRQPRLT